jgi:zinc protease
MFRKEGHAREGSRREELKLAKRSISRSLPAQFHDLAEPAGTIGSLFLYDLPPDYYQGLPKRIEDMTAADVYAATKTHLQPVSMRVIAVGDRKAIDKQIAALKLGPVGYRLPDGRPVSAAEKVHMPIP